MGAGPVHRRVGAQCPRRYAQPGPGPEQLHVPSVLAVVSCMDIPALGGRVALISGASRGVGQAIAATLAGLGADIGMVQRTEARDTVKVVEAAGRRSAV